MREQALSFRQKVRQGQRLLGSFSFLSSPTVVEILGQAGLDFVIIDMEHCPKSWEAVENMVRAAELCGMAALIRVAQIDEKQILQALEVGAAGIMVPFVESADDVRSAMSALRYAPDGKRGTCTQTRAAGYGANRTRFVELARQCNEELLLIGLIENRKGLDNIEEILGVKNGLDVVFIGRSDLATDLGRPGQSGDAMVEAATEKILAAARAANLQAGIAQYTPVECESWAARGCSFFAFPSESGLLFDAVSTLRREVDARWRIAAQPAP
jgi:2-keto-3-deoxy-L-rhamnonate aldolase RhmA